MLDLLRLLLPQRCPGCGGQLGREPGLCRICRGRLRPQVEEHSPLSPRAEPHLVTLGRYAGVTRRAVRALKYSGARDVAQPLGQVLAAGVPASWAVQAVVPVPLHPSRQRQRGYNQAELLARAVAAELGVPVLPLLVRTRATAQQARQHAAGRRSNLAGAFAVRGALPGGSLLLLDDVLTTGNTLLACRDALDAAGAGPLKYAAVAR